MKNIMEKRNRFITALLKEYLKKNDNVLDIGCGSGDLSFIASEIVGHNGYVLGIDSNQNAINIANDRKNDAASNIEFKTVNLENQKELENIDIKFDAIICRRVLMYLDSPDIILQNLKKMLKPKGYIIFEESDSLAMSLNENMPIHNKYQKLIWDTVKFEKGNINMGRDLFSFIKNVGFEVLEYRSENIFDENPEKSDLIFILEMMKDRILNANLISKEEFDIKSIEKDLNNEANDSKYAYIRDITFGIVGKKL